MRAATAAAFGDPAATLAALLADPGSAPAGARLKPLLDYARKLTLTPAKLTPADADAVLAAGWDEQALHDTVAVCALFNMMNRVAAGLGITGSTEYFAVAADRRTTAATAHSATSCERPGPAWHQPLQAFAPALRGVLG